MTVKKILMFVTLVRKKSCLTIYIEWVRAAWEHADVDRKTELIRTRILYITISFCWKASILRSVDVVFTNPFNLVTWFTSIAFFTVPVEFKLIVTNVDSNLRPIIIQLLQHVA